jgi:hypothetical protein
VTTAADLITGALRQLNVLAAGEVVDASEGADALAVLNDLIDTWSTEHLTVFNNNENVLVLSAGKYSYTVGNPVGGQFSGVVTQGSNVITGVTIPTGIIVGSNLSAPGIPSAAVVTAIGTSTITFTPGLPATATFPAQLITFTIPGDFPIERPLRITNVYTRLTQGGSTGIDYPCEIWSGDQYTSIGLKQQPGPWPKGVYYNENFPLGQLLFWPVPTMGGELHMWTDDVFTQFSNLTDTVQLPQGYARALKKNLALELAPEYNKTPSPALIAAARTSKMALKALNATPQTPATYDPAIGSSTRADAGWILHGGFR